MSTYGDREEENSEESENCVSQTASPTVRHSFRFAFFVWWCQFRCDRLKAAHTKAHYMIINSGSAYCYLAVDSLLPRPLSTRCLLAVVDRGTISCTVKNIMRDGLEGEGTLELRVGAEGAGP